MDNRRIDRSSFECYKDTAIRWLGRQVISPNYWRSVADLRERFREAEVFIYEADMFEFCKMAGLITRTDEDGKRWVKANPSQAKAA